LMKCMTTDTTVTDELFKERVDHFKKFIETWNLKLPKGWIRELHRDIDKGNVICKSLTCGERILTTLLAYLLPKRSNNVICLGMSLDLFLLTSSYEQIRYHPCQQRINVSIAAAYIYLRVYLVSFYRPSFGVTCCQKFGRNQWAPLQLSPFLLSK